jgi:serine/threonine-protein kinase RsbW
MTEQRMDLETVSDRLELAAPAEPEIIDLLHALVEHLWQRHPDVSEGDRTRFEMAAVEILANIVEHAFRLDSAAPGRQRRFVVTLAVTPTELVAAFGDNGLPMEIDLSEVVLPTDLAESGRGLALAAAALDDLEYTRVEGRNHWRLLCVRKPA